MALLTNKSLIVLLMLLVASVLTKFHIYSDFNTVNCNTSVTKAVRYSDRPMQVTPPVFTSDMFGEPFYCVYQFIAPKGHYVMSEVKSVVTAHHSFNFTKQSCGKKNYLRIWDGIQQSPWKPTDLCGFYQKDTINVKRIVSGREMKIEFRVEKLTEHTTYDVRVSFQPIELSHETIETRFGGYNDVLGKVPGTLCDWNIEVNKCIGFCEITSPGFPGIYPPHTACTYKLMNKEGERVELYLSGMNSRLGGKFDIKRSDECSEDKVVVFDGETIQDPIIGIFCGELSAPEIISTGSALLIQLVSLAGTAPWHYSGFDARVTHRYPSQFRTGMPVGGKLCTWEFNSTIDKFGTIHTPDHQTTEGIECEYRFFGKRDEVVELEIRISYLEENEEFLFIYDGTFPEKIWSENAEEMKEEFAYFNTTTSTPVIQYLLNKPQLSNAQPIFIHYRFVNSFREEQTTPRLAAAPVQQDKSSSTVTHVSSVLKDVLLSIVLIFKFYQILIF